MTNCIAKKCENRRTQANIICRDDDLIEHDLPRGLRVDARLLRNLFATHQGNDSLWCADQVRYRRP